jgi:hypothetical protein
MNTMQSAFASAGLAPSRRPVTPWNPSRKQVSRVKNPLPAPGACPYCAGAVQIVSNSLIYGREVGEWPWAYRCEGCGASVGMHPFTNIPLGTLADARTRVARRRAKAEFTWMYERVGMTRSDAYVWLARQLARPVGETHIAWFDEATCQRVVEVIRAQACEQNEDRQ